LRHAHERDEVSSERCRPAHERNRSDAARGGTWRVRAPGTTSGAARARDPSRWCATGTPARSAGHA